MKPLTRTRLAWAHLGALTVTIAMAAHHANTPTIALGLGLATTIALSALLALDEVA